MAETDVHAPCTDGHVPGTCPVRTMLWKHSTLSLKFAHFQNKSWHQNGINNVHFNINMNVMRHTACLVVNPVTVENFAVLFNCMPAGRTSDLMMAPA